jgi:transcription elongation factor GreA
MAIFIGCQPSGWPLLKIKPWMRHASGVHRPDKGETNLERTPITRTGYEKLSAELRHLKTVERPRVIQAIEEARAHGDLSENAEFAAAKDRQSFIEGRISELQYKLANADVIVPDKLSKDKAVFGSKVLLENIETGEDVEYQLVGSDESDIEKGRISVSSPLGRAIVGKKPGDELTFEVPGGKRVYELVEIL